MIRSLVFTLTSIFCTSAFCANSKSVSLQDALNKGLIQVATKGLGGHQGQCIEITITSLNKKEMEILIDAGLQLLPSDTSAQSMMVSQEKIFTLTSKTLKKIKLYALCTQQSDRGPSADELFALGPVAEGHLLTVAQFLSKKKYQTSAAQHAVWCITDSASIGGIYDETNPALAKELRMLVAKLTGKIPPWYQTEYNIQPGVQETFEPLRIHADFKYALTEEGDVTFAIFNEQGDTVRTILANHAEKAGIHMMKIKFESSKLPKGKYYARVTNKGTLIEEKVFEL
ncbi:MAG: hypothetical protein SH857_05405 [Chitinophagales bacterium]|mgnify:CR=1 FL=1|nr:hypothetical protein [Chitinophagales bacterium]